PQWAALNFERRKLTLARCDPRAHLPERRQNALHGPPRKRFVAKNARDKWLRRQDAGEHANGRAGVARIQIPRRLPQTIQALAMNHELRARAFYLNTQRAHRAQSGMAIRARRVVPNA